ncbi:MAG: VOC family protein [Allorhizobium sp.]
MNETAGRIEVLPVLPSLDIGESQRFYSERLGFEEIVFESGDYLIVRRQFCGAPIEVHFWLTDDRSLCERSSVYLRGGGIDRLYDEFSRAKVERLSEMQVRPWNMEEFYVIDPHGNLLKFGRVPQ